MLYHLAYFCYVPVSAKIIAVLLLGKLRLYISLALFSSSIITLRAGQEARLVRMRKG